MSSLRIIFIILISLIISKPTYAKNPSDLIKEIVDQASIILSSDDPVESKIIKLNDIAERSVDINGIGMYTLGKYRKSISEEDKSKYQKLFKSYFLKSFSSRLVDYTDPKINVISEKKHRKGRNMFNLFRKWRNVHCSYKYSLWRTQE